MLFRAACHTSICRNPLPWIPPSRIFSSYPVCASNLSRHDGSNVLPNGQSEQVYSHKRGRTRSDRVLKETLLQSRLPCLLMLRLNPIQYTIGQIHIEDYEEGQDPELIFNERC